MSLDRAADEAAAQYVVQHYLGSRGLGTYRDRGLGKDQRALIEKLEALIASSSIDMVSLLIDELDRNHYSAPEPSTGRGYRNVNLSYRMRSRPYPHSFVRLLERISKPPHAVLYVKLLDAPDLSVVVWAAGMVKKLGDAKVASEVGRRLAETLDRSDQRYAKVGALTVYFQFATDPQPVTAALSDEDWIVRTHAIRALAKQGIRSALPTIREMLSAPDLDVRVEAGRALKMLELGTVACRIGGL